MEARRCVQYTPRQDGNGNGIIGGFEIRLSEDGTTFPDAATAKGTWANTPDVKTIEFPAAEAKAIRLTALTEAGGNGPWTSAAEINVRQPVSAISTLCVRACSKGARCDLCI